jgi:hypothetical protein
LFFFCLEKDIKDRSLREVLKGNTDRMADIMKDREEFWMTKREYDEGGLRAVLSKIGKS